MLMESKSSYTKLKSIIKLKLLKIIIVTLKLRAN